MRVFVSDGLASVTNQLTAVIREGNVAPVLAVTLSGGIPTLTFSTIPGCKYRSLYQTELSGSAWVPLIRSPRFSAPDGWSAAASGTTLAIDDPTVVGEPRRFYRLEMRRP